MSDPYEDIFSKIALLVPVPPVRPWDNDLVVVEAYIDAYETFFFEELKASRETPRDAVFTYSLQMLLDLYAAVKSPAPNDDLRARLEQHVALAALTLQDEQVRDTALLVCRDRLPDSTRASMLAGELVKNSTWVDRYLMGLVKRKYSGNDPICDNPRCRRRRRADPLCACSCDSWFYCSEKCRSTHFVQHHRGYCYVVAKASEDGVVEDDAYAFKKKTMYRWVLHRIKLNGVAEVDELFDKYKSSYVSFLRKTVGVRDASNAAVTDMAWHLTELKLLYVKERPDEAVGDAQLRRHFGELGYDELHGRLQAMIQRSGGGERVDRWEFLEMIGRTYVAIRGVLAPTCSYCANAFSKVVSCDCDCVFYCSGHCKREHWNDAYEPHEKLCFENAKPRWDPKSEVVARRECAFCFSVNEQKAHSPSCAWPSFEKRRFPRLEGLKAMNYMNNIRDLVGKYVEAYAAFARDDLAVRDERRQFVFAFNCLKNKLFFSTTTNVAERAWNREKQRPRNVFVMVAFCVGNRFLDFDANDTKDPDTTERFEIWARGDTCDHCKRIRKTKACACGDAKYCSDNCAMAAWTEKHFAECSHEWEGVCDHCEMATRTWICPLCKVAQYCGKACQENAWKKGHKTTCAGKR